MEHFCFELHYQCLIEMIVGVKDFSLIGTIFFFLLLSLSWNFKSCVVLVNVCVGLVMHSPAQLWGRCCMLLCNLHKDTSGIVIFAGCVMGC